MTHIIFIFALLFTIPKLNKKYPYYIFSFCILFLFLVLRYDYGNDYMSYLNMHTEINAGTSSFGSVEILFKYLNLLIPNFYCMVAGISLFYILTIYFFIKCNLEVKSYWFALLILLINPYLFLIQLSSIRQTIAICFVLIAVKFAVKRKPIMYSIFILIAAGFHLSSIILLPLYFILNDSKVKKKWIIVIYGFLGVLICTPIFEIVLNNVLKYFPLNYTYYFQQGSHNSIRATLISSFFFFLIIANIDKLEGKQIIYGKLSLIAAIVSLLAIKTSMLTRVEMYFDIFLIITIPQIFIKIKSKHNKQILFFVMLLIYILRYVSFFTNTMWTDKYSIYKTIIGKLIMGS